MAKAAPPSHWDGFRSDSNRIAERKLMLNATKETIPLEGYIEDEGNESGTIRLFPSATLKKYNAFLRISKKDVVGVPVALEGGSERPKSEIKQRLYVKRGAFVSAAVDFCLEQKALGRGLGVVFERRLSLEPACTFGPIVSMNPPTDIYVHLYQGSHCEIRLTKFFGLHTPFGPVVWKTETVPYYVRLGDDLRLRLEDTLLEVHLIVLNGPANAEIHLSVIDERGIINLPGGQLADSDASNRIAAGLPLQTPPPPHPATEPEESKENRIIGQIVE